MTEVWSEVSTKPMAALMQTRRLADADEAIA